MAQLVAVAPEEEVPLSTAFPGQRLTQRQLLFWLGQKRHPSIPLYNMVVEFEIEGELDAARFCASFGDLVASCDALRSVFTEAGGIARRVVLPPDRYRLDFEDLSDLADPSTAYRERMLAGSAQEFDLGRRCFDSKLFKLGAQRHIWWFCQHHLIGDGASVGLLYRSLVERYQGGSVGTLGSAAAAEAQERAYQRSPRAAEDEVFWAPRRRRTTTRGQYYAHPELEHGRHIERLSLELDSETTDRLRNLAKAHGVAALPDLAIACLFKTALLAYLYRLSGKSEQALGIPFRNRHGRASKSAVGCFIEVLPVQVDVQAGDTFESLFRRVQQETMSVLGHGQACVSNSEAHPLFDVSFNFLAERYPAFAGLPTTATFSTGLHALGPLTAEPLSYWPGGESLTIHCQDYRGDGRYTLWFDFLSLFFDREQRQRALGHFHNVLRALLSDMSTPIDAVEMVGEAERAQLVVSWNPEWIERSPNLTVVELFEEQVRRGPERVAVSYREERISYAELDARASRLSRELRRLGVGGDDLVGVLLERSPHVPVALLGVLKAGGAYVPLDPSHPATRNAVVMEDARPRVVVTEKSLAESGAVPAGVTTLLIDELTELSSSEDAPASAERRGSSLAYVLFTSGSSGRPKGVAVPHAALANFLLSMQREPGLGPDDRVLAITTIGFDIAALELYLPLVTGASLELVDRATAADPLLLAQLIRERAPTVMQATPATWQMLFDIGWPGDPRVKALCGGEALSPELAVKLSSSVGELWNMYGPTETTVWSSLAKIDPERPLPITIGSPIENTAIYVLNEALKLAPIGVPGEICIGGAGVARGYHENPALTAARFRADPYASRPDARIYRTGDLGLRRSDGRLECLGRLDFQVKIRGYRIELGEIESALLRYPGVGAAVVVAREDRPGDKHLAAYLVPRAEGTLDVKDVRRFVQELLPSYMVPAAFTMLDALPLTPNGKVDRKALPRPELASAVQHAPPRSDMELRVAAIFEKLLGVTSVSRDDNFFDLGGHSLLAAQLLVTLNRISKCPLSIGQIFQRPTVKELSQLLLEGGTSDDALVIPLNRAKTGTPLFCVCGIHLYSEFAQAIGGDHPVFGVYLPAEERSLAAARLHGKHLSVEELASGYLEAVRRQQPKGPYCLAGVSFGGVLAYEMAQQLVRSGERVALLAMFDSALPRAKRRRWGRWIAAHARAALKKGSLEYVAHRVRKMMGEYRAQRTPPAPEQVPAEMQFRVGVYLQASRLYDTVVQPYPGSILLFRANSREEEFQGYELDPQLGWGSLARHVETFDAPGDHLGILLEPGVRTLAAPIRAVLDALASQHALSAEPRKNENS